MEEGTTPSNPLQIWIKALTQPNTDTYTQIVRDPGASMGKALLWLAGAGFLGGLINGILSWIFDFRILGPRFNQFTEFGDFQFMRAAGGFMAVIAGMFGGLIGTLIAALLITGIVQLVARALGGTGSFEDLFYGYAAFQAPLGFITGILSIIPFVNCLTLPLAVYGFVLMVIANKAVHQYDTGKAVISSLTPFLILFALLCCIFVLGAAFFATFLDSVTGGGLLNSLSVP